MFIVNIKRLLPFSCLFDKNPTSILYWFVLYVLRFTILFLISVYTFHAGNQRHINVQFMLIYIVIVYLNQHPNDMAYLSCLCHNLCCLDLDWISSMPCNRYLLNKHLNYMNVIFLVLFFSPHSLFLSLSLRQFIHLLLSLFLLLIRLLLFIYFFLFRFNWHESIFYYFSLFSDAGSSENRFIVRTERKEAIYTATESSTARNRMLCGSSR